MSTPNDQSSNGQPRVTGNQSGSGNAISSNVNVVTLDKVAEKVQDMILPSISTMLEEKLKTVVEKLNVNGHVSTGSGSHLGLIDPGATRKRQASGDPESDFEADGSADSDSESEHDSQKVGQLGAERAWIPPSCTSEVALGSMKTRLNPLIHNHGILVMISNEKTRMRKLRI